MSYRPFSDWTTFDHLNTILVRYSDPHFSRISDPHCITTRNCLTTYRSASVFSSLKNLEPLHDDATGDNGVCRRDGWDDVARHRLYVESRLLCDAEDVCTNVGARRNEIHRALVVLVPHQRVLVIGRLKQVK